jgi:hypothetical protein
MSKKPKPPNRWVFCKQCDQLLYYEVGTPAGGLAQEEKKKVREVKAAPAKKVKKRVVAAEETDGANPGEPKTLIHYCRHCGYSETIQKLSDHPI